MKLFIKKEQKEIWFCQLDKPYDFTTPFSDEPFVCILFNNEQFICNDDQNKISDGLVLLNCRCAVCAGYNCSSWDDSIDWAYLSTDEDYNPPDETFIMTTWHDREPIEDIIWYGLNNTNFDDIVFNKYLILFVGFKKGLKKEVERAIINQWIELDCN